MAETDEVVITRRPGGWTNSPLDPVALALVGRPARRRIVTLLLTLAVLIFGGTVIVADAAGSKLRPTSPCSSAG
jgi:hypothetical protein